MVFGDADIGCDLHAVRGGDQLSEVLLDDPETSVFRVCSWLHSRQAARALAREQPEKYYTWMAATHDVILNVILWKKQENIPKGPVI